jgi:hypothetical protein
MRRIRSVVSHRATRPNGRPRRVPGTPVAAEPTNFKRYWRFAWAARTGADRPGRPGSPPME